MPTKVKLWCATEDDDSPLSSIRSLAISKTLAAYRHLEAKIAAILCATSSVGEGGIESCLDIGFLLFLYFLTQTTISRRYFNLDYSFSQQFLRDHLTSLLLLVRKIHWWPEMAIFLGSSSLALLSDDLRAFGIQAPRSSLKRMGIDPEMLTIRAKLEFLCCIVVAAVPNLMLAEIFWRYEIEPPVLLSMYLACSIIAHGPIPVARFILHCTALLLCLARIWNALTGQRLVLNLNNLSQGIRCAETAPLREGGLRGCSTEIAKAIWFVDA